MLTLRAGHLLVAPAHHTFGRIRVSRYHKLLLLIIGLVIAASAIVYKIDMREGLDLAGGIRVVLEADEKELPKNIKQRSEKMNAVVKVITNRVQGTLGVAEPQVQLQGTNRVIVELPGYQDEKKAIDTIKSTDRLEFYWLRDVKTDRNPSAKWELIKDQDGVDEDAYSFVNLVTDEVIRGNTPEGREQILKQVVRAKKFDPEGYEPVLTGDHLKPKSEGTLNQGNPVILIEFNPEGTRIFRDFTRRHVGDILAIFLGDQMLTAPVINEAIPRGQAEISGFSSLKEAVGQASFLNAGALPVALEIAEMTTVEPTLGKETVDQALMAGIIGLLLVGLFMLLYYRLPGFIADIALCIYALLTFAVYKSVGATMTLPGLAGFILSIGMAVDANILIFERLKEELKSGKTLRAAIDAGFSRAFSAIFDSNMCTVITCVLLMWIGVGSVQSFAFTLAVGVVISMFSAITVTRTFLHLIVSLPKLQKPWLFGLNTSWIKNKDSVSGRQMDIVGKRNYFFVLSGILIAIGLFFIINHGLVPGIEFQSGTSIQATFKQPVTHTEVTEMMSDMDVRSEVQISKGKTAFIRTSLDPGADSKKIDAIKAMLGDKVEPGKTQVSSVGPLISSEITKKATWALMLAGIGIVLYLSFRFAIGGFANGFRYGMSAIIALAHDVLLSVGFFALAGKQWGWETDTLFVTALMTIIGFSVHDTIVIFDRIRENLRHRVKGDTYESIANGSILQSLTRTINTSFTVMLTLVALIAFGGPIIQRFYIVLLIGIVVGVYSTIFNAASILVVWDKFAANRKLRKQPGYDHDKPMVAAKDMKPMVPAAGNGSAGDVEDEGAATADSVKVKPKRKKRRY